MSVPGSCFFYQSVVARVAQKGAGSTKKTKRLSGNASNLFGFTTIELNTSYPNSLQMSQCKLTARDLTPIKLEDSGYPSLHGPRRRLKLELSSGHLRAFGFRISDVWSDGNVAGSRYEFDPPVTPLLSHGTIIKLVFRL